jgi:trehalose-6-phosphate hydrolase
LGNDSQYRVESAKMLAASIHMMQGTPYVYQGEEIGMTNPSYTSIEQYRDVESTNMYDIMVNQQGVSDQEMLAILAQKSRDNSRTPMQWNSQAYAGFSQGQPWLEVASNYLQINAEQALADKNSVFYFYQRLIELRKTVPVITDGDYRDLLPSHPAIFAYQRQDDQQILLCINNYYDQEEEWVLPDELPLENARYLLGNYAGIEQQSVLAHQVLRPYETRVIVIDR